MPQGFWSEILYRFGTVFLPGPPSAHGWTIQPLLAVRTGIPQRALDRLSYR